MDFGLRRGERVALAGPNGAGKSTLLRIVAGTLDFDAGQRTLGHNVRVVFYAQHQLEALDANASILQELERSAQIDDIPRLRGHLGAFLFSGDDVDKKISVLSGGEKARVALAKMLLRPANLLVLDEPTNHLDIQSREVLEQALASYEGTLVFVSHDRAFINALATRVVEVKYGVLREFIGNYDDYLHRLARLDESAGQPEPARSPGAQTSRAPARRTAPGGSSVRETAPTAGPKQSARPKKSKAERQLERERRKSRDRITRRIERTEEEIHERERALEQLEWRLGDPAVYADADALGAVQADQVAQRGAIDELYAAWERLSDELAALDDLIV
jgi:ATP-binding cassette subfamily F protein 3